MAEPQGHGSTDDAGRRRRGAAAVWEVFVVFLGLGLTSFGGPVAHLGYFREALVGRRRWLTDASYVQLVSLCHFLPGPASSQLGMAIGLQRAGIPGLLAAWLGFTMPSALAMAAFGYGIGPAGGTGTAPWAAGLMAAAVAVVAQAVLAMAPLASGPRRATIAVTAMVAVLVAPAPITQILVIAAAGVAGLLWLDPSVPATDAEAPAARIGRGTGAACLIAFGVLLVVLPLATSGGGAGWRMIAGFYQAGALVFGGGHVVLPLLEAQTVQAGLVGPDVFLAGYGAAQAVPGPLFTFAAFLGFVAATPPNGAAGAGLALIAIFLPSALLIIGVHPFWERLRASSAATRALAGVNAAVVGILAAALYTPVFTAGIDSPAAMALAAACFVALRVWNAPPWAVVLAAGALGASILG